MEDSNLKTLVSSVSFKMSLGLMIVLLTLPGLASANMEAPAYSGQSDLGWNLERPMVINSSLEQRDYLFVEPTPQGIKFSRCQADNESCQYAAFLPFKADTHGKLLKLIEISDSNAQTVSWTQWGILVVGGAACIYFGYRSGQVSNGLLCGAGVTGLAFGGAYLLDEYVLEEELSTLDEMAIGAVFEPLMNYEPEVEISMSLENYLRNIKIVESLLRNYSVN